MKELNINCNDAGKRLDAFLRRAVPLLPQSLLYKYIRSKRIKRNGKRAAIDDRLCEGDTVQLYINDEFFATHDAPQVFLRAPAEADIVYEDKDLLVLSKPAGLVVHEDDAGTPDTLINRVRHLLYIRGEYDPAAENSFAPALCNRIDRNTAGLVLCAKNAATLRVLNQKIRDREIEKRYLAAAFGVPDPKSGTLRHYLRKDEAGNRVTVFDHPVEGARTAITDYTTLDVKNGISLLDITLHTGRTHQIRAQLAHVGHPLVGDAKYGGASETQRSRALGYTGQALCACRLTLRFTTPAEHLEPLNGRVFEMDATPLFLPLGFRARR